MAIRAFLGNSSGNIAISMALLAIPLFGVAGIAVDYGQKLTAQARLQAAIDAGTLAGAALSNATETRIETAIRKSVKANGTDRYLSGDDSLQIVIREDGGIRVVAQGSVPTTLSRVLGIEEMPVSAIAEARRGEAGAEVALVLDNTKSMEGTKLANLKSASTSFVSRLSRLNTTGEDRVRIAIVPYAQYVNVGVDKRSETWLDVGADKPVVWRNCRIPGSERQETFSGNRDGVSTTWSDTVWDYYDETDPRCVDHTWTETWQGCVGSRPAPHNLGDGSYGVRVPGIVDRLCPTPITALTHEQSQLDTAIAAMTTDNFWKDGDTYIPIGLAWGWKALSSAVPFTEGVDAATASSEGISKHLVLMTDGVNTRSRNTGTGSDPHFSAYHDEAGSSAETEADTITASLCENIKAQGITIYTVAFQVADADTAALLRNCATSPNYYFDAGNATQLTSSFEAIAEKVAAVRLSK